MVLPGLIAGLPEVSSWRMETAGATASRVRYREALLPHLEVRGARLQLDPAHDEARGEIPPQEKHG